MIEIETKTVRTMTAKITSLPDLIALVESARRNGMVNSEILVSTNDGVEISIVSTVTGTTNRRRRIEDEEDDDVDEDEDDDDREP